MGLLEAVVLLAFTHSLGVRHAEDVIRNPGWQADTELLLGRSQPFLQLGAGLSQGLGEGEDDIIGSLVGVQVTPIPSRQLEEEIGVSQSSLLDVASIPGVLGRRDLEEIAGEKNLTFVFSSRLEQRGEVSPEVWCRSC